MQVAKVEQSDYPELIEVWKLSVRLTHNFLSEENILTLKP